MITINGDKWIVDHSELKEAERAGLSDEDIYTGNLPESSVDHFLHSLLFKKCWPMKFDAATRCWSSEYDYREILESLAVNQVHNNVFSVYQFQSGAVWLVYVDYEYENWEYVKDYKVELFTNKEEYMKAVSFPQENE